MPLSEIRVAPISAAVMTGPVQVSNRRVALSDLVLETMEPAEIEAELARRWSLPLRDWPDVRPVLVFFVSLCIGMALSTATVFVLKPLRPAMAPMALVCAVILAWHIEGWLMRLTDRRAAGLVGSAEVVKCAAGKLAAMQLAPWKWECAMPMPPVNAATSLPGADAARVFSSARRRRMANVQGVAVLLAFSIPPVAVAIAVRAGTIPAAARWPAYLAGMALALLLRLAVGRAVSCWNYRKLRSAIGASLGMAESETVIFVGLSPEPRVLIYDGFADWDLGFLSLSKDRLDYQGEKARFTLGPEQVTKIRVGEGSPQSDDPLWVFLSWRDAESGRDGTFPLILPRVRAPWRHTPEIRKLYRALVAWKNGADPVAADTDRPEWGVPVFPAGAGAPYPNQLLQTATLIAVGGAGMSLLTGFPIASEATLYFALVWTANALWDLFGHRFTAPAEKATA